MLYDEANDVEDDLLEDDNPTTLAAEQSNPMPAKQDTSRPEDDDKADVIDSSTGNTQESVDDASVFEPFDEGMIANITEYEPAGIVKDSRMLLQAARSKNTGLTTQILQKCPNLKTDLQDEVGKTALHYLCNTNNPEEVRLCAQKTADINMMDKMGWTPLHYASLRGHKDVVEALLGMGADCNIPETDGKSVTDVAKSDSLREVIVHAIETYATEQPFSSEDVTEDKRDVEKMQIEPNKVTPFLNLGIAVKHLVMNDGPEVERNTHPFALTLKRTTGTLDLGKYELQESDDLCSDEFTVKLDGLKGKADTVMEMSIELISGPNQKEEMVFKTDTLQEIAVTDIREENGKFRGTVSVNITSIKSFVVVCRPKLEKFEVGDEASTLKSTVDDRVELDIQAGTFEQKVTISMEITETPPKEQLSAVLAECDGLSSTSAFYSFEAGNCEFSKPISVKVPLPLNYTGTGNLLIVSMDKPPDEEKPEHWKLIEGEPTIVNNRVEFVVSSFSIKCALESPYPMSRASSVMSDASFGSQISLASQVSKVFRKSRRKEFKVKFFCMAARQGTSNTFRIVTECCIHDKLTSRVAFWESEGFKLQGNMLDLDNTTPLTVNAKDKFMLKTSEIQFSGTDNTVTMIEFHPKRENNHRENTLKISDVNNVTQGYIAVYKVDKGQTVEGNDAALEEVAGMEVILHKFHPDMLKELDGKSFLTYTRMIDIQDKLGEHWWKVLLLLDIPFTKLEQTLQNRSLDLQEKINGALFDWRESNRQEKSRGIPILLSALSRSKKNGLVHSLRKQLVTWKNDPQNKSDGFYEWLENAYTYNLLLPIRRTKPMSDPFLAMLADIVKPSTELIERLGVNTVHGPEVLNAGGIYSTPGLKTMKILTLFRAHRPGTRRQLDGLVAALRELNLIEPMDYAVMWTKCWVTDSKKTQSNDPDLGELEQLIGQLKD